MGQPDPLPTYGSDARRDTDIDRLAAQSPAHIADRLAVGASILAWWLIGRGDGEGEHPADPDGTLPTLSPWVRR